MSNNSKAKFDSEAVKAEFNQYWYSQLTIDALTAEVVHHATRCAYLSTPSLFFALDKPQEGCSEDTLKRLRELRANSLLFEFDKQWEKDPCFVHYDFRYPDRIPVQHMGTCDYVVVDPPFITDDVWEAYITTVKLLLKEDGKVLFTTVLENHTMLEGLMNGPLFIPPFRPCVQHLTYQYVCYLNYDATRLQQPNPEIPAEDPKILLAINMANDIRHSEKAFAIQMETRPRQGEQLLPTAAHEKDKANAHDDRCPPTALVEPPKSAEELARIPISDLRWGYIPEGLTMYANGSNTMPADSSSNQAGDDVEALGPVYAAAFSLRADLDTFKNSIDSMQKLMDALMRARIRRAKTRKELNVDAEGVAAKPLSDDEKQLMQEADKGVSDAEAARQAHLDTMQTLAEHIIIEEKRLHQLRQSAAAAEDADDNDVAVSASPVVAYTDAMTECIAAYRAVEARKTPLQELAADATRKYKSPVFSRMKELLQDMKDMKKKKNNNNTSAAAAASDAAVLE